MTAIDRILAKAADGTRITPDECLALFACRDLHKLGRAAHAVTMRLHPEPYRTFNIDRNINYTNVCAAPCATSARSSARAADSGRLCIIARRNCTRRLRKRSRLEAIRPSCKGGNHPSLEARMV